MLNKYISKFERSTCLLHCIQKIFKAKISVRDFIYFLVSNCNLDILKVNFVNQQKVSIFQ